MKSDLTLSEAFELYRKDVIVYKNQSAKTEEMNNCAMKSIINFLGDIPITDLSFDAVRKWTADLRKTRTSNTVRGYILKIRVVLKHLRALGYEDVLDPEAGYEVYLTREERMQGIEVVSPYVSSRTLDVTDALQGQTLRCRDFVTLQEGVTNDTADTY